MGQISSIYAGREPLKRKQPRPKRPLSRGSIKRMAATAKKRARLTSLVRANGFPYCRDGVKISTLIEVLKAKGIKFD